MNLYKHLLRNIPLSGIWAFVNNRNKCMYIAYSEDVLGGVARNIRLMRKNEHPIDGLNRHKNVIQIEILQPGAIKDKEEWGLHVKYFVDKYKKAGYRMYREYDGVVYRPCVYINRKDFEYTVHVALRNRRNKKMVVGVFPTIETANEWVEQVYAPQDIIFPVFAANKATRDYVLEME